MDARPPVPAVMDYCFCPAVSGSGQEQWSRTLFPGNGTGGSDHAGSFCCRCSPGAIRAPPLGVMRALVLLGRCQTWFGTLPFGIALALLLHNLCLDQFHDLKWFGCSRHGGDGLRSAKLCSRRVSLVHRTAIADEPSLTSRYFVLCDTGAPSFADHVESVENLKNLLLTAAVSVAIPVSDFVCVELASANPH